MTLEKFSAILIIMALITVPCIPSLWYTYCILRDVIKLIKGGPEARRDLPDAPDESSAAEQNEVGQ